jgi:short-subunit dehydrogenase
MHEGRNAAFVNIVRTSHAIVGSLALGGGLLWAAGRVRLADLRGQLVVITGGSKGLGLALARKFGKLGCRLVICARTPGPLAEAEASLKNDGFDAVGIPCDVSDSAQVSAMFQQIRETHGSVDILVNNAGEILVAPLENTTEADIERAMKVMFWGVVHSTLAVLPDMRRRGAGRIATITSIGGKVSVPHLLAYSCAKSAAVAFSEGLRAELGSTGIAVTTIVPGLMRTGSHVNAHFKGQQKLESAWFSASATAPLLAMNAERAAEQIVRAIRRGSTERILTPQASLLARVQGAFPGLIPDVLSLVNRMLPYAEPSDSREATGRELVSEQGRFMRIATTLGRQAGQRLNQAPS